MRIKHFILGLMAFIVGALHAMADKVVNNTDGRDATVRVMSFNIRFNNPLDTLDTSWDARRGPCGVMLNQYHPDVVGIQEPREDMRQEIYEMMPDYDHYCVEPSDTLPANHTGRVVLLYLRDRYELLDSGHFWLSATPYCQSVPWNSTDTHYRVAIWIHLRDKSTGKDFYAVSTHFPYKKAPVDTEVRAKCSALITSRMKEIGGDDSTIFVFGDLNATPVLTDPQAPGSISLAPLYEWMESARDKSIVSDDNSSFNGFGRVASGTKGKNLDHIFYRNATPIVFETIDRPVYGVRWISDHYPIMATFTY